MRRFLPTAIILFVLGASACTATVYDEPGPECYAGEAYCVDAFHIESCYGGRFVVFDCDDVCYDAGFAYTTGCGYDPTVDLDACFCE